MPKIFIICNDSATLYSQRKELIETLHAKGFELAAVCQRVLHADDIERLGCKIIPLATERHSKNPFKDFALINQYKRILKSEKPDVVLTYHIKPNCYAGYVCGRLGIPYLANVCGLGTPLEIKNPLRPLIVRLYKAGVKKASCVFFQNKENEKFFDERNMAPGHHHLIPGSGVDTKRFALLPYPHEEKIRFLYISRIMKEKGIDQLLGAAEIIHERHPETGFDIVGGCDDESYLSKLEDAQRSGAVVYHGQQSDVIKFQKISSCTVLPTYYPEGINNVLLESAASARPIITTDRSGCREIIDDGVNGFICKQRDTEDLVMQIEKFLALPVENRVEMGLCGRTKVEKEFDRQIVIKAYLDEIDSALKNS